MKIQFFFKIALVLFFAIAMTNCTKETTIEEQNPLAGYLSASGFNQDTTQYVNSGSYEFGISFKPMVDGKITAIIVKIPDIQMNMRVTIWDKNSATILRTELMDITSSGVDITKNISALTLVKNTEYMITFNSDDWYDRRKTDNSNVTYPFTVGDIFITGYAFVGGATQQIPTVSTFNYYAGDLSFKFQKS